MGVRNFPCCPATRAILPVSRATRQKRFRKIAVATRLEESDGMPASANVSAISLQQP
jgi:hypothetical protein